MRVSAIRLDRMAFCIQLIHEDDAYQKVTTSQYSLSKRPSVAISNDARHHVCRRLGSHHCWHIGTHHLASRSMGHSGAALSASWPSSRRKNIGD